MKTNGRVTMICQKDSASGHFTSARSFPFLISSRGNFPGCFNQSNNLLTLTVCLVGSS